MFQGNLMTANAALIRASTACTIMVIIGFFDLPYGYYTILRLVLCGAAIGVIYFAFDQLNEVFRWIFGAVAILYNPIFPIYLGDKSVWIVLNILTILMFWFVLGVVRRDSRNRVDNEQE